MIVMQYATEGDLHKYLRKNFTEITWNKQKLAILWQISEGYLFIPIYLLYLFIFFHDVIATFFYFRLETIHKAEFIHRDFHSGNIYII